MVLYFLTQSFLFFYVLAVLVQFYYCQAANTTKIPLTYADLDNNNDETTTTIPSTIEVDLDPEPALDNRELVLAILLPICALLLFIGFVAILMSRKRTKRKHKLRKQLSEHNMRKNNSSISMSSMYSNGDDQYAGSKKNSVNTLRNLSYVTTIETIVEEEPVAAPVQSYVKNTNASHNFAKRNSKENPFSKEFKLKTTTRPSFEIAPSEETASINSSGSSQSEDLELTIRL